MSKQESTRTLELEDDRAAIIERIAIALCVDHNGLDAWGDVDDFDRAICRRDAATALTAIGWHEEHQST